MSVGRPRPGEQSAWDLFVELGGPRIVSFRESREPQPDPVGWDDLFWPADGTLRPTEHMPGDPCTICDARGRLWQAWLHSDDEQPEPTRANARDLYRDALPAELAETP